MKILSGNRITLGDVVRMQIEALSGSGERVVTWRIARTTDRSAGDIGVDDSVVGPYLVGAGVDDEILVEPAGGDPFLVTVLDVRH